MKSFRIFAGCILLFCLFIGCNSQTKPTHVFPSSTGFVNDFDDIFTPEEEAKLLQLVKNHETATTDQITVVTLKSIAPYTDLDAYSLDLANYWTVGQKDKNNGILIAIFVSKRKIRIQNGYGIVERLSDSETKKIIDQVMIPEFKNTNYYEGTYNGIVAIINKLNE